MSSPCPHKPTSTCPCKNVAYRLESNHDNITIDSWQQTNSVIEVRRINSRVLRIQPNLAYPEAYPELDKDFGYNTALRIVTSKNSDFLYIGFAVTETEGEILIQPVTPLNF